MEIAVACMGQDQFGQEHVARLKRVRRRRVGLVDGDLVRAEVAEQDKLAVGREVERSDHGPHLVDGRVIGVIGPPCRLRRIILGALFDPPSNQ